MQTATIGLEPFRPPLALRSDCAHLAQLPLPALLYHVLIVRKNNEKPRD
jgi:hypothetical protein